MEVMRWLRMAAMFLCLLAAVSMAQAQSTRPQDLGQGKLLVASPDLADPNFAKTVVLLVEYNDDGVVGLILNRRSKVPISRVLDALPSAKNRSDLVYAGGPVGRTDILALVRAGKAPADAKHVLGDVYLASTKESLERTFSGGGDAGTVHVYLGYSGWTEPQLENEVNLGGWYILPGTGKLIFDDDPDSVWDRLIRLTETRIAATPARFRPVFP